MIEPTDIDRFRRHARTLEYKINDAEAVGVGLDLLQAFEDAFYLAIARLKAEGFSWRELARGTPLSHQALEQRFSRWAPVYVEGWLRDTP